MNYLESTHLTHIQPPSVKSCLAAVFSAFIRVKPQGKVNSNCATDGKQLFSELYDRNTTITKDTLSSHLNQEQTFHSFQ